MRTPYIEINLEKIYENACLIKQIWQEAGIEVMGVTKVDLGEPHIAQTLVDAGITLLGDSRIDDIIRMKKTGIEATYCLIRSPFLSDIKRTVKYADITLNSELEIIKALDKEAYRQNKIHKIVLMIEMGDRREGILPEQVDEYVKAIVELEYIELAGIGANFACFGGSRPTQEKMNQLSLLANTIEQEFDIELSMISGGNSANFIWLQEEGYAGRVNNVRLGESIFLGVETLYRKPIKGLHQDAFKIVGEVIELKEKPSLPNGEVTLNAFGETPHFEDRGTIPRAIVGLGREDVDINGLIPHLDVDILGGSSDHMILDAKKSGLKVGDFITFSLSYSSLLAAMTSPFVRKKFIGGSH
jgi:predicted amino acid racemase